MSFISDAIAPYRLYVELALAAAIAGGAVYAVHHYGNKREAAGAAKVQALWNEDNLKRAAAAIAEEQDHARETLRRLQAQQTNQERQNEELAIAHAAADRNTRDAERVRQQAATAADQWSHTLRNSPTAADLAAADDTIRVLTDVRGRLDQHAGVIARYATAAHLAGLKCERDYDALKSAPQSR